MFDLLREGDMTPTAAAVADRAGVGLRTVFRHFEDMESIFEEMTEELKAVTMPKVVAPFDASDWRDQLIELVDRNAELWESVFPMQVALVLRRFQSEFLQKQYHSEVQLLRSSLKTILPRKVAQNRHLFAAFEVNFTFATWRRLREDQGLSVDNGKKALKLIIRALIKEAEAL
ncbi:MAG: TetR/AcrR family transcriptional regulator [Hyphomonadaceae bacterium]|nr:TetR/AcrR family transcriptional regulator [Hyphomonadaceae bacterium]